MPNVLCCSVIAREGRPGFPPAGDRGGSPGCHEEVQGQCLRGHHGPDHHPGTVMYTPGTLLYTPGTIMYPT